MRAAAATQGGKPAERGLLQSAQDIIGQDRLSQEQDFRRNESAKDRRARAREARADRNLQSKYYEDLASSRNARDEAYSSYQQAGASLREARLNQFNQIMQQAQNEQDPNRRMQLQQMAYQLLSGSYRPPGLDQMMAGMFGMGGMGGNPGLGNFQQDPNYNLMPPVREK